MDTKQTVMEGHEQRLADTNTQNCGDNPVKGVKYPTTHKICVGDIDR